MAALSKVAKSMNKRLVIASEVVNFCSERDWRYCVIGGFALQHWGRTEDDDGCPPNSTKEEGKRLSHEDARTQSKEALL